MEKRNFYEPIEVASRDEIEALQYARLKIVLQKVYEHVPFYKKHFDAHGVHPDDFKHLEDIQKFPFTEKQHLRENYPFGLFAEPREKILRVHASSGTTGKPTVVGYTKNDIENWAKVVARSIYASGGRPGDILQVSYGYGLFTGGLGAHYGAEKLGCTVIPISGGNTEKQLQLINDFKPDIIMVTPSYMLNLLEHMQAKGMDAKNCSLRIGIFGAEPWTNEVRKYIQKELNMQATDIYGLSEIIGPGVANECFEDLGDLYVWEDHFYPEIIESKTLKVLPENMPGELVFSSLTKEAMPLIRFRTKDLSCLMPGRVRSMRRMQKILGRNDDMLIIRGVNVFPSQIEEIIFSFHELAPLYQLEVDKSESLNKLVVHIEMKASHAKAILGQPQKQQALSERIRRRIKERVGINVELHFHESAGIERSIGKAKRIIEKKNV